MMDAEARGLDMLKRCGATLKHGKDGSTPNADLSNLISQWTECLTFLPRGQRLGYMECIEELDAVMSGDRSPIEELEGE